MEILHLKIMIIAIFSYPLCGEELSVMSAEELEKLEREDLHYYANEV